MNPGRAILLDMHRWRGLFRRLGTSGGRVKFQPLNFTSELIRLQLSGFKAKSRLVMCCINSAPNDPLMAIKYNDEEP